MTKRPEKRSKTMKKIGIILIIVGTLLATQVPVLRQNFREVKRAQAKQDAAVIALAVLKLYDDVGQWPSTDQNGPAAGPGIDRLFSAPGHVPQNPGPEAGSGAENWGKPAYAKPLADFLFFNNPDDDSGKINHNQAGEDYDTRGTLRWRGPYLDSPEMQDPWGQSYVINARYFPDNPRYKNKMKHRVYILSAGPNQMWETPFDDASGNGKDKIQGDDIGVMITHNGISSD